LESHVTIEQQRRTNMTFFSKADAPTLEDDGIMTYAPMDVEPEVFTNVDLGALAAAQHVTVLFKGEGPGGFSLVHVFFPAGYRLPRHSHNADCMYYVVAGEAHMGKRVLKPGDGFFIRSEAPYTYTAGPNGVEVLEFRTATSFDFKFHDKTMADWQPVMEAVEANKEHWATERATEVARHA
jgi:quercetin dioxygenase-like cupin family protein